MKKSLEKTNMALATERGYSFRAVNHDGASLFFQHGVLQEIFSGIYITVDPQSGIGLVEVNPAERTAKLLLNDQEVLDIVQVSRHDVLSVDGKKYVFLKYMDAFFNKDRVRGPGPVVVEAAPRVVPIVTLEKHPRAIAAVLSGSSIIQRMPKRTKILAAVTAVVTTASLSAAVFFGPNASSPLEEKGVEGTIVEVELAKPVKQGPSTLNELIEGDASLSTTAAVEPGAKDTPAGIEDRVAKSPANAATPSAATSVKPTHSNKVKKHIAVPAPAAKVSAAALKSLENDYQEAVLIKGYDQERSERILRQLQKKVPAGTALRQKIDKELR